MISVIIPALNEAQNLPGVLAALAGDGVEAEIIVVDGGSADGTPDVARRAGVRVIETAPGRGGQLRAGAEAAAGDVLWFLHADSHIDSCGYRAMTATMANGHYLGGAFSLQIDSPQPVLRTISRLATLRSRYLNLVYGDQGIFVRREVFRDLKGFSPLPICEDLDFFRKLKKRGPVVILREKAVTSPRRWLSEGIGFTTFRNIAIASWFLMGFSPAALSRWYPPKR